MPKRSKRSRFWIDPKIQGTLARRVVLHWGVLVLLTLVVTTMVHFFSDPNKPFTQHIAEVWKHQRIFLLVVTMLLPAFILDTVKLSNRFVGPIVRLRRVFSDMAAGKKPEKLNFRGQDFWEGLATDFNRFIEESHRPGGELLPRSGADTTAQNDSKVDQTESELEPSV